MMKGLLVGVAVTFAVSGFSYAGEPPSNDPPGVDKNIKPEEITVFMAEAHDMGPWPENVYPVDKKMPNVEWVIEQETGLKICRRTYIYILDKAAGGQTPNGEQESMHASLADMGLLGKIIPLHPDATKPFVCARMGMMTPQLAPGTKWWNYKFACPQRSLDEKGRTVFKDPPCPIDCHCVDEPVGL